jgi:glycosyltransferase involved in cell wall biosynthesis
VKPIILVLADWYLPGYKAGGQITATANVIEGIGNTFELLVFTRDRDLTDKCPYPDIRHNAWIPMGKARVLYTSDLSFRHLRRRIHEVMPEVIYLNSFFSILGIKTLCLRKLGLLPACAIVLAPRGEFSPGALKIKRWRKSIYRTIVLRAGLYRGVVWQASSELEREHIAIALRATHLEHPRIHVAWDLPSQDWLQATKAAPKPAKSAGARFLCVSRVSPMKNFVFALDLLGKLTGHVEFDIFGPIDDRGYWEECQRRIEALPSNVTVRYRGTIPREDVPSVAAQYHFFLLPTQGENFGYAILESLAAGCPVILSDRTPWRDVTERGVGWSLPLDDGELWQRILQQCVDMEQQPYAAFSRRAREFIEAWATSNNHNEETVQLFNLALRGGDLPSLSSSLGVSTGLRE